MTYDRLAGASVALAFAALVACSSDGATTAKDKELSQAQFPQQADIIDDIRNGLLGGGETGATPGAGGGGAIPLHGDPPLLLGDGNGPYWVDSYPIGSGTVYYPSNAPAPFAGMALCGGFLNSGFEMSGWGEFYASWGIVTVITDTFPLDFPDDRAVNLAASIQELKGENTNPISPLFGKMSGRYGTSGYSMGGGGTTIATSSDWTLQSSIGMAPWLPTGFLVQTPTLLMCGDADIVAPCEMAEAAYDEIPDTTPKLMVMLGVGVDHLDWFGPDAAFGQGGAYGLAFAKVFLEGDTRWKAKLLSLGGDVYTNID
jgi:hypothetical protein